MAKIEVETKFYLFRQNNSGGSFDIDDEKGVGPRVWVEAISQHDACDRARNLGIYFGGVSSGRDCECCGDRWYEPWDHDTAETLEIDHKYDFNWHDTVYVHHFDGPVERIKKPEAAA